MKSAGTTVVEGLSAAVPRRGCTGKTSARTTSVVTSETESTSDGCRNFFIRDLPIYTHNARRRATLPASPRPPHNGSLRRRATFTVQASGGSGPTGGLTMLILSLIAAITTSIIMRFNEPEPAKVAVEKRDRSRRHRR
jgi:hypothetical protein